MYQQLRCFFSGFPKKESARLGLAGSSCVAHPRIRSKGRLPGSSLALALCTALGTALGIMPAYATDYIDLPELGDASELALTPQLEEKLGRITIRRIRRHLVEDVEVQSYLRAMGGKLATSNNANESRFHFSVLKDPRINAFAAPGGVVALNAGIFLNAKDQHEAAAVLAHEIAHVIQRHLARSFSRRPTLTLQTAVALIGAIALSSLDPELGKAAIALGPAALLQREINFTRAHEQEADRVGMQFLHRAGFDPKGMPRFFSRLLRTTHYAQSTAPEFLRTHPLTENRLAETQTLALNFPSAEYPADLEFELVKARLNLYKLGGPLKATAHFRSELEQKAAVLPAYKVAGLRYGYVLALTQAGDFAQAQEQIDTLMREDGGSISYLLAAGRLAIARGNLEQGLQLLEQAQQLYPDRVEPVLESASGLLSADRPAEAQQLLRNYGRFQKDLDPGYYELKAQVEKEAGFPAESQLALAEFHYINGSTEKAVDQLKGSLQQGDINRYDRQRIQARLEQFEDIRAMEKKLKL